ncbi:NUDIX domain-containing protein [Sphingomonas sp. CD22]|uniref:NUDIX hydrolase n=1 Tax=Sphingomonas sp. CD22 TaxID=3100214 RepID=UPI002AE0AA4A|nr:NUDIX domain-containing protein [Sphingomonas sp. CD22]MEA1085827.1 NUDIX domain-containing protein [Sphingomonas sp. CD22]
MDDATFLASYDPAAFPPLAVAVDVVPLTFTNGSLCVLLNKRTELPARGRLALPGTFVRADEELGAAAQRALRDKAGLDAPVRQFHAFGAVARDPRMRIVSIGYMAVVDAEIMGRASTPLGTCELLPINGGVLRTAAGRRTSLPFDHDAILSRALSDLRRDLDRDDWAFGLLPECFSLRELQALHEAIRGQTLNKPAFRKRLIESGRLEATGEMETGKGFRPAELYRARRTDHAAD